MGSLVFSVQHEVLGWQGKLNAAVQLSLEVMEELRLYLCVLLHTAFFNLSQAISRLNGNQDPGIEIMVLLLITAELSLTVL